MNLGVCRQQGVQGACGSTNSDGRMVDAQQCFGFTLATNFDPCVVRDTNGDSTLDQVATFDSDTGMFKDPPGFMLPGFDDSELIDLGGGPRVRVIRRGDMYIPATGVLNVTGSTPLLFVVHTMRIEGVIDLNAANNSPFTSCTATVGTTVNYAGGGGGGGGFAAMGGAGGQGGTAAMSSGRAIGGAVLAGFSPLRGSCAGRKGGGANGGTPGVGGAAGGAIQITARDSITLSGSIRANGGGGGGGVATASPLCTPSGICGAGGGGGGAGGLIFLEGPMVTIGSSARVCANGGGGGGGAGTMGGTAGIAAGGGLLCANASPMGGNGNGGGAGGAGGSVASAPGANGGDGNGASDSSGGGGGGGVGRIGVHATMPMISTPQVASPAIEML